MEELLRELKEAKTMTLKVARIKSGMTQKQASAASGIAENTISLWERGIHSPTLKGLKRLCDVYGVDVGDIILP